MTGYCEYCPTSGHCIVCGQTHDPFYAVTYLDMCDNRIWLNDALLPTQRQEFAHKFETAEDAKRALAKFKKESPGILFPLSASVVALPFVDQAEESTRRQSARIFERWPVRSPEQLPEKR